MDGKNNICDRCSLDNAISCAEELLNIFYGFDGGVKGL